MLNVKALAVATVLGWAALTANQIAHMLNLIPEHGAEVRQ